jgi:ATP-binding cassette subfamily B protein
MVSSIDLQEFGWAAWRLGEALELLAQRSGLSTKTGEILAPPENVKPLMTAGNEQGRAVTQRWIEAVASQMDLEVEAVETTYPQVESLVLNAAPALLRLPVNPGNGDAPSFLAMAKGGRRSVRLLTLDGALRRVPLEAVRAAICEPMEQPLLEPIEKLLGEAEVPVERMKQVRRAILREQLAQARIGDCWLLRLAPNADMWRQARRAGLHRHLVTFVSLHLVQYLILIASWWFVGRAVLGANFESAWLIAWALLLLTAIPLQLWQGWSQSMLAIGAGGLFKRRLLYGALRLEPEEVRNQGAGQFLGRVMESEAVELLAVGGGFAALVAIVELVLAMIVLSQGAGGVVHSLLLLAWVVLALILGWAYYRRSRDWITAQVTMTDDLVERMVGHRTRLAQESPETWHQTEDRLLADYLERTVNRDRVGVFITALIPRGWLILGLASIVYAYLTGTSTPAALAVSLGGILLASQALNSVVAGYSSLIAARLAWDQVAPIYQAADRPTESAEPSSVFLVEDVSRHLEAASSQAPQAKPFLTAREVGFRYQAHGLPVLAGCNLDVCSGDRLLLEGPSGGGKSTLASLLIGLRVPESGLLLYHGLDRHSVGADAWRRRVVAAPQFQENYVLTGTMAFNLLLGRRWPAGPKDLEEAEQVCRELGLGTVLDRMPAGLQQMVGEGGWQLSNGEKSRLYIARALLQKAEMIIFDESFASLDPENLRRALECVLRRAPTLMVIAHP